MRNAAGDDFLKIFGGKLEEVPGVYGQGLQVYGHGGELIYQRFLEFDVIASCEEFCERNSLSVIAYAGDRIIAKKLTDQTNKIVQYCEPIPEVYQRGLSKLSEINVSVNKLIILAEEIQLKDLRPIVESLF